MYLDGCVIHRLTLTPSRLVVLVGDLQNDNREPPTPITVAPGRAPVLPSSLIKRNWGSRGGGSRGGGRPMTAQTSGSGGDSSVSDETSDDEGTATQLAVAHVHTPHSQQCVYRVDWWPWPRAHGTIAVQGSTSAARLARGH